MVLYKNDFRRSFRTVAFAACAVALLLSCADDGDGESARLVVDNRSAGYTVWGVYTVRTAEWAGWGISRLTTDIEPGERVNVPLEPDTWDIRIDGDHPDAPRDFSGVVVRDGMEVYVEVSDGAIEAWW